MHRSIIKVLLLLTLASSPAFAVESLSALNFQTPASFSGSSGEASYFAKQLRISKSGYYGFSVGGGTIYLKPEISMSRDGDLKGKINQDKTGNHYNIGLFTGYGASFNQFYLGAELSAFLNLLNESAKGRVTDVIELKSLCTQAIIGARIHHDLEVTVKQPITTSLDIMPGYFNQDKNFLFYGRFGVGANWLTFDLTDSFGPGNNVSTSANRIRFDYRLGFGLEYFMNDNFGLRLEYVYSRISGNDDHKISDDETRTIFEIETACKFVSTDDYKYFYGLGNASIHTINLSFVIHP